MALTFLYGYSTPTPRRSEAQLNQILTWSRMHPEFRRRLASMFTMALADGTDVGFGGGWRSEAQQRALFLSRYYPSPNGTLFWEGQYWLKKPGVAPSAPPGRSYHEESTSDGYALAADLIGDLTWVKANCARFGLVEFSEVNNEPWHIQPVEIPTARRNYVESTHRLKVWALPTDPSEEVPKEGLVLGVIKIIGANASFVGWTDGKGHYLDVSWIRSEEELNGLIQVGAYVNVFAKPTMSWLVLLGKVPTGDIVGWSTSDFKAVIGG